MEGWRPVEDLIRWGFGHAPVVMANEAHSGLARCVRTREVGVRMVRVAHEAGVRRLAMEVREPLAPLGETLAAYGGNARIPRDQAPPPLDGWTGIDAVVVSADNELTR